MPQSYKKYGPGFGKDVNLPDENAGKEIGKLLPGEKSKDPLKQSYRERLKKKKNISEFQRRGSDTIFGGDPDDPRWNKFFNERKTKK